MFKPINSLLHVRALQPPILAKPHILLIFSFLFASFFTMQAQAQNYRASASNGVTTGVLTLTINKPTGTVSGDVMIAAIAVRPNTATITAPAGWTLIRRTDQSLGNTNSQATYWKAAGASEPASYSWTFNTSTGAAGGISTFYNINTINPINVQSGQTTASALTHATPSVTTTDANTMVVTTYSFTSSATWTPPAGMTESIDKSSDPVPTTGGISMSMNYAVQAATGATGIKTATASNDADNGTAQVVVLEPSYIWTGAVNTAWTTAGNWRNGVVPTSSVDVVIPSTVNKPTISTSVNCNDLYISSGATLTTSSAGTLNLSGNIVNSGTMTNNGTTNFSGTVQQTFSGVTTFYNLTLNNASGLLLGSSISINNNLTITTGTLNTNSNNITLSGNFINNGGFTAGSGMFTFAGATSKTVTGSSTTAFNDITVNKGTSSTSIIDVQSLMTMSSGGLTLTNGTFKISSASTITPFTTDITVAPFLIPATAGLWCNGGTISGSAMSWTIAGTLRTSAGVMNVGSATDNRIIPQSTTSIIIEGGTTNVASRISANGVAWTYSMTGGTLVLATVGNTTSGRSPFNMDVTACSFSMSAGTIIIRGSGGSAGEYLGYNNMATGGTGFTGGTLQIGNASTPAGDTIKINTTNPIYNLTIASANVTALLEANNVTVTNDVTISSGKLIANSHSMLVGGDWTNNASTAGFTAGVDSVTFNGTAAQSISGSFATTFNDLIISNTGNTVTSSVNTNISSDLSVSSGTFDLGAFTANRLSAGGTLNISNGATLRIGGTNTLPSNYSTHVIGATSTVDYDGTNQIVSVLKSAQSYGNLTISGSGTKTAAGAFSVNGALTLNASTILNMVTYPLSGTITTIAGTGTIRTQNTSLTPIPSNETWTGAVEFNNATGGQSIVRGTYNHLINSNTSGVNTARSLISVSSILTLNANSTLDMEVNALTGSFTTVNGTGLLETQNTSALPIPTGKTWPGKVEYNNAAGGQTIVAATYTNLTNSNTSGTNTAAGAFSVSGTLTLNANSLLNMVTYALSGTLTSITGTGTIRTQNTTATPIPSGKTWPGTVVYNNTTGGQTAVAATYTNLTNGNTSGNNAVSGNITVTGTFTLTGGTITTGANSIYINATGTVARTAGHVVGNFKKYIATGATSKTFEIGDALNYTPATIAFASVTTAGDLTVSVTNADHPNLSGSGIRTDKSVNRYVTLTNSAIVFTTYSLTINWVAGNVDAGSATANFKVGRYINPNWVFPTVASPLATSIQATGVNAFGDFAFGELCSLTSGFSYSGSAYCPNAGTATPTITGTAGTFTSTAGLFITAGTGAVNLAASTPGTYTVTNTVNGSGGCTSSSTASITINVAPGTPGVITGSTFVCPGTTGQVYSISPVADATTYNWTVPTGWTITAGAGTTSITVTTGAPGNISVTAANTCQVGAASNLAVTTDPISVSATIGTLNACYTTLKLAFDAINAGTHQGVITIHVNGSTTETVVALLNGSGVGSSNYSSVNIFPTASGYSIGGTLGSPLIDFGGADNVVIDGRVNASGSTPDLTFRNASTATNSSTIRFINSAESNTIKYCNVSGASLATAGGMIFFSSTASGNGNINNTIDNCILTGINDTTRPVSIIYSSGTSLRQNTGNVISNNKIVDFLTTATSSYGLNLRTATSDWTISGNSFYQTTPFNPTAANTYRAIYITNTSGTNFTITNNYIGGSAPQCGGTAWTAGSSGSLSHSLYAIDLSVGALGTSSIQNNTIKNFDYTSRNTTPWQGIRITNGNVNVGTITGNTIGDITGNSSITVTNTVASSTSYGIYLSSNDTLNILNNKIGSVTTVGSTVSHDFIGIAKTATATVNIGNNTIGSLTTSNSIQAITPATSGGQNVIGISCVALGTATVSGNTIANMYNAYLPPSGTSGQIVGIDISGAGTYTVQNNIVRDLSTTSPNTTATASASVIGISEASTAADNTVTGNTIYNLSNTTPAAAVSIIGLYYSGSASGTNIVSNNFVHSLSLTSSSTVADIYGIKIGAGTTTYSNNIVSIGTGITTGYPIFGIYETGGASNNNNLYFNSVYIGGTTSGASGLTYALFSNTNNNARDFRNNILYNGRSTAGATNTHFAIRIAGTTSLTIDFNNFFANGTGGTICRIGTTNYATISAWQTALAAIGGGMNGLNIDPLFASAGGTSASDYYASEILTGVNGTGITTDYFGTITRLDPPKMGALDCSFNPTVTSTTPASRCGTGTVTLTATASAGATIYWYDAATGGNLLGTGTSFTTPSIAVTTTFYAAAIYPSCRSSFRTAITATILPPPTGSVSGTASACINSSSPVITFTGDNATAPYIFTFNINGGLSQTITSGSGTNPVSVTLAAPTSTTGSFTYALTSIASTGVNTCTQAVADTAIITVTASPAAVISYTGSPFCKSLGTSQPVSQSGTAGGTYSSTAGLTINASNGAITPSTSTAGTYTVTYTMAATGNCAQQTATTSVTITTLPAATISYTGTPFCNSLATGQPVSQTGTAGGTYSSTAGLTINASTGAITPSTSSVGTYTVTYTMAATGGCAQQIATTSVTITQIPTTSNAGADQTSVATCGLTSVTLAGNTPTMGTGAWSIVSGASGMVTNPTSATSTFSGIAGTSYTLRWTTTNGSCTSTDDVIITFNRTPTTSNAGADQTGATTCGLTTVTLAGNTATIGTGAWSIISGTGGSFGNAASATSTFSGTAGTAYVLKWTISNSPCTASTDNVNITFNRNPTTAAAGADQTGSSTCGLTTVTLAANVPSIGTGAWSIVSGAGGSFANSASPTSTFSGTAGTAYVLRWTISNSPCIASTDDVNITFNRNPTTAAAGADQTGSTTCGLTTVTLAANAPSVGTGAWSIISGAGGTVTTPSSATSTFTGTAGTIYTLRWTISNSPCTASTDDVVITFNRNPTTSNAGADQTGASTCGITTVTLAGNAPSIGTGAWSIVSGTGGTITTPSSATSTFTGTAGSTYTLRWTVSNSPCTASTDDVVITFNQNPTATISYAGTPFCTSVAATQNVTRTGTTGGTYSSTAGLTINASTGAIIPATSTAGTYIVTYTMNNGPCITTATTSVTITAAPSATINYAGSPYYSGSGTATITRTGTTGGTYSSTVGLTINGSTGDVTLGTSTLGTYTVTYTIAAAGGCSAYSTTASISIGDAKTWDGGAGTNNWGDANNWNPNGVPVSSDKILLSGAYIININVAAQTNNLTLNNSSLVLTVTSGNSLTVSGDLTLTAGVLNTAASFPTVSGTVNVTGGTVGFTSSGVQTIPAYNYNNLTSSSTGGRILASSGTIGIKGTFTPGTNNYTTTGSTIVFNGTSSQSIGGMSFNNLTINNAAGVTLTADVTYVGILTLTSGLISTGAYRLIGSSTGSVSRTSGHVNGNFKKYVATGATNKTFEIGDAINYTPVTVAFASVTAAGDLTANTSVGDHDSIGTSQIQALKSVNRTWKLTNSGVVFTTYNATFNFVPGDVDAGVNTSTLLAANYGNNSWTYPTVGTRTATSTQAVGLTNFDEFQIGFFMRYHYKTMASGQWDKWQTWDYSTDGGLTWAKATKGPTLDSDSVLILTGHTVTADVNIHPALLSVNGTFDPLAGVTMTGGILTGSGIVYVTRTTGTADFNTQYNTLTKDLTNLTIDYSGAEAQTINNLPYKNLILSNAGVKTLPTSALTISGDFTTSGSVSTTAATSLTIDGNVTLGSGTSVNLGSTTHNIAGNWTNNGATVSAGTSTVNFNGTSTQTLGGSATSLNFNNVTVSNAVVVNTNANISGILNMNGTNSMLTPAATVIFNSAGATGTVMGSGTIKVTRLVATADYSSQYKFSTNTLTNLTVDYTGAGAQTVNALTYGNLKASGSGTIGVAGNIVVDGVLTIPAGVTLNMGTNILAGTVTSTTGTGTLATQNTSATPIPASKTWTCAINYNSSLPQNIVAGNYTNLTASGGDRTLSSTGSIGIAGTFAPGSGTYTVGTSTIDFNGTGAQTIPAFTFNNVTFSGGNTKTAGGNFIVNNILTIGANTILALSANNITLKSTATATARVAAIPPTASITYGTGRFVVERYIAGRRKYRLVTSSVTTHANTSLTTGEEAYSIWGNWQSAGLNTYQNMGMLITGGTSTDGFDPQTTNASMYTYDAVSRKYIGFTSANGKNTKYTPLKAGVGYYMFVYGDRQNSVSATNPRPTVLQATGTLLTGDQLYNTSSAIPLSDVNGRFTLLGNPYACTVDWKSVNKYNVSKTIWGWDANMSSTGAYVTVTATAAGSIVAPISELIKVSRYVQPGQAFFVQTTGANPELLIKEMDKVDSSNRINNTVFRGTGGDDEQPLMAFNLIYYSAGTPILADGAVAAFDAAFSNRVTDEDAIKMVNSGEGVAIAKGSNLLSIETREMPQENDTIFLNLAKLTKAQYTLEIFAQKMAGSLAKPYLEDTYLNITRPLSLVDTNRLVFTINTDPNSSKADRFRVVFRSAITLPVTFTNITAAPREKNVEVKWTVAGEAGMKKYEVERSTNGTTFTKAGEVNANGISAHSYDWLDVNAVAGNNYYRVRGVQADGSSLYTKVVVVKIEAGNPAITVYPNPVENNIVHLYLKDLEKGEYVLQIQSPDGREVYNQNIDHIGGSSHESIPVKSSLPGGTYFLRLLNKKGKGKYHYTIYLD